MPRTDVVKTVVTDRPEVRAADNAGEMVVQPMKWYEILAVRTVRTMAQVFIGLMAPAVIIPAVLPSGMTGFILAPVVDQALMAGQVALLAGVWTLALNGYELIQKLDVTNPRQRA